LPLGLDDPEADPWEGEEADEDYGDDVHGDVPLLPSQHAASPVTGPSLAGFGARLRGLTALRQPGETLGQAMSREMATRQP